MTFRKRFPVCITLNLVGAWRFANISIADLERNIYRLQNGFFSYQFASSYLACNNKMYFLLNFVTGFLFIVCTNADIINSNLINQLLNKNKDRIVKEFKQTDFSQGIVDNYVMDLLSNYILRSSKINFPTAFSDSVSLQCKSDSILYMEEVLLQSIAPNADSWALRSQFVNCILS